MRSSQKRYCARGHELYNDHGLQIDPETKPHSGNGLRQPIHFELRLSWLSGQRYVPGTPACTRIQ